MATLAALDELLAHLGKGRDARDRPPDNKCLDGVGALEGVDGLNVGEVASNVVIQQDSVAAEDVPRQAAHPSRRSGRVELGKRCMLELDPTRASNCARRTHIICIPVMSATMRANLSWINWKAVSGLPNCLRRLA